MLYADSADGTRIAFDQTGHGTPVVIVGGAFSTADAGAPLAAALKAAGFQAVTVDRRARGKSTDTSPYSPRREVEDLTAVLHAVGGDAAVLGHSSGAMLALLAAAEGAPISHLFLSEPPFLFGEGEPSMDLPQRLQALVDSGNPADAVTTFQREGIGLPEAFIEQIQASPMFDSLVPLAQSAVYDALLSQAVSTPTAAMAQVSVPVTILRGTTTYPVIMDATEKLARRMPQAVLVTVPESHDHSPDPTGTVREIRRRIPVQ
ncbi:MULTISPECIES: alpha/beta fold hydrolase [Arthrobacter]|uniref:Alpha/beta hydrolase n=1 Tax=Arthrobacter jinronghuae TaxID=2964609 RepID=A0ABT1NRT3_9MICC|nr:MULTISPECIES: alpha/beta hydrolase [Arthrobacter]MCQ1950433.1 alpha/beta hydrolase [Arthrobacter jinronghuae]MCQ1953165.1 alpha/beta hydrolase [Arthrobacter sp. zg-Y238]MCQ1956411.1 alpha/beta hydrolase [Arthrobacter jinronghuae]UWX77407.1 alpha/beta hydrolase [Arthrobacter jinronghuae]